MKRNIVLALIGVIILLAILFIMLMWPRRASEPEPLQDVLEREETPAVEEAAFTPLPDLHVSDTDEPEDLEEESGVDDNPETFHDLVDDLAGSDNDETIRFKEEEWETIEGDPDDVPPIFRIAP